MLTVKDKIEQFKRECKSRSYYAMKIAECNEKIEYLDAKLRGVSSPNGNTGPKCENAYSANKIDLIMDQDEVIRKRNDYIKRISYVDDTLDKITDSADRKLVKDLYVLKKNHQNMADKYHYASRSAMYKHVNSVLRKILKEDTL